MEQHDRHLEPIEVEPDLTISLPEGHRVVEARRHMASSMMCLFDAINALGASEAHRAEYSDTATWIRWHLGVSRPTARTWTRVAEALLELPILRDAFATGRLSLDQVDVLVRHAGGRTEQELLEIVARHTELEELRRELAQVERRVDTAAADEPSLSADWRDNRLHIRGVIPGADGVMVERALERVAVRAPKQEDSGLPRNPETRLGEALIEISSASLADEQRSAADRATVVVHMTADDLVHKRGPGWTAAQQLLSPSEIERLLCDARMQPSIHDTDGVTVGIGRTTRTIPAWLRRIIEGRDEGCRFPGCGRTRWLECHHVVPWSKGGPTNLDNLVSLCGFHHRLIHRQSWTINGHPGRTLTFFNRWGLAHQPLAAPFTERDTERRLELIDWRARTLTASLDPP